MAAETAREDSSFRTIRLFALLVALALSILAAFRGGYIGPDYDMHMARLTSWDKVFDFAATSPPGYYLIGHALFRLIGAQNAFPITLSIFQATINAVALWYFFQYTARAFNSRWLHLALALFLTFLPVRVIHAAVIGTDCATIPLFVLLLFLFDKVRTEETATVKNAALLGFGLSIAVFAKYSFMALLPAIFLVLFAIWQMRRWGWKRFGAICALSLVVPTVFSLFSFWASSRVHGYNTEKHWLGRNAAADMNYKDLLSVKAADVQLFRAPEYFKRDILVAHKHGYLALSHMGTFSDPMNLFQDLSVPQRYDSILIPDQKTRRPWKVPVMKMSILSGVPWTLLGLIGTAWALVGAGRRFGRDQLKREDIALIFGTAFFLLMFLPIPFVHAGALFGYWTPRLILPSLLCFFLAGFLFIDQKISANGKPAIALLGLVIVQCAIEATLLS
jgi:4-amino-4-deoxy-L-arabinose transferase-like glycosyltransferase